MYNQRVDPLSKWGRVYELMSESFLLQLQISGPLFMLPLFRRVSYMHLTEDKLN